MSVEIVLWAVAALLVTAGVAVARNGRPKTHEAVYGTCLALSLLACLVALARLPSPRQPGRH